MPKLVLTLINDLAFDRRILRIIKSLQDLEIDITVINVCKNQPTKSQQDYDFEYIPLITKSKSGIGFYTEVIMKLRKALRNLSYDILYSVDYDTLAAGLYSATDYWIFDAHELFHEVPELAGQGLKKRIWSQIASTSLKKTDLNITVSNSLAGYFSSLYNVPFEVVRNFPLLTSEEPSNRFDSTLLVYQGALNKGRGLEIFLEAIQKLPDYRLALVGDGDIKEQLKDVTKQLNIENQVKFVGKVPPEELKQYTEQGFLGYNLLDDISLSYYYSLANKFSDYFHAGLPSLNSLFPEYEYYCNQYHVGLCIPFSVEAIVQSVTKLKSDENLYNQMFEGCLEARQSLNWQKEKLHFQSLITKLISK